MGIWVVALFLVVGTWWGVEMVGSQARHYPHPLHWWVAGGGDAKCLGTSWAERDCFLKRKCGGGPGLWRRGTENLGQVTAQRREGSHQTVEQDSLIVKVGRPWGLTLDDGSGMMGPEIFHIPHVFLMPSKDIIFGPGVVDRENRVLDSNTGFWTVKSVLCH